MYGRSYQTRRRQTEDSSAFEHIFVGESRDGEVLGFHNWMRFYQLEKNGYIDYKGFYVSIFSDHKKNNGSFSKAHFPK